ncbi:hypothetical protein AVEN_185809-1 [Araneus ventricosus]|uniref:Uncharacterized protein n=1 Tax=Araneus ventricosus TaxID=182803 RepID=A0A4Y2W1L1_ARAVE|nr:hypothetical protein AVEN_185809-1 [Araneus ventricosus]
MTMKTPEQAPLQTSAPRQRVDILSFLTCLDFEVSILRTCEDSHCNFELWSDVGNGKLEPHPDFSAAIPHPRECIKVSPNFADFGSVRRQ